MGVRIYGDEGIFVGIKVEFFATLRETLGTHYLQLDSAGTVEEAINAMIEKFGEKFRDAIMEGSRVREMVKILVNGKDIRDLKGLMTELRDGDCVSIFPPVAGG